MTIDLELQMSKKVQCLKTFVSELITFRENSLKFKAETDVVREKMIISFEVSLANHLMAVRDLLFYPVFHEPTKPPIYVPTENYHALSISVIARAMLESLAILYWLLLGDEQTVSFKVTEYLNIFNLRVL